MYLRFQIKIPACLESVILYFLLYYRKKRYGYSFRRIRLAKDRFAIVDPDDFQNLSRYDWHLNERKGKCYAATFNEGKILYMHRLITNAPKGTIVDHRNHESLDNRKANLRFAEQWQNCCNKRINTKDKTSRYRGVSLIKKINKWQAIIYCKGKSIYLGLFENEVDAAMAYDTAAKIYHGNFAMLNFPNIQK